MSTTGAPTIYPTELVALDDLLPHPRNYRAHPLDQRRHLVASLEQHGVYRNVVVARDGTLLAGHGVIEAAREVGLEEIPVVRLPLDADDPRALRILAADNELTRLAVVDDRVLADLLREVRESDDVVGLLGTGYDDAMLANLVFVSRPESEIASRRDADAWVGLPVYDGVDEPVRLVISFDSEKDRKRLLGELGIEEIHKGTRGVLSVWWPARERVKLSSLRFEDVGR